MADSGLAGCRLYYVAGTPLELPDPQQVTNLEATGEVLDAIHRIQALVRGSRWGARTVAFRRVPGALVLAHRHPLWRLRPGGQGLQFLRHRFHTLRSPGGRSGERGHLARPQRSPGAAREAPLELVRAGLRAWSSEALRLGLRLGLRHHHPADARLLVRGLRLVPGLGRARRRLLEIS